MRFLAWFGGFLAIAVVGGGIVSTARPSSHPVASTQLQSTSVAGFSLPQNLLPPPSPTPLPVKAETTNPPARTAPAPAKPPAKPPVVVNSTQQAMINQDRARYHLAPLTWSSCLSAVARYEAAKLATAGVSFQHYDGVNRHLGCHLGRQVGENIGWYSGGINDTWMNSAFMNSPDHKANILGPYRYVATAWAVRSDGRAFIAVEFG